MQQEVTDFQTLYNVGLAFSRNYKTRCAKFGAFTNKFGTETFCIGNGDFTFIDGDFDTLFNGVDDIFIYPTEYNRFTKELLDKKQLPEKTLHTFDFIKRDFSKSYIKETYNLLRDDLMKIDSVIGLVRSKYHCSNSDILSFNKENLSLLFAKGGAGICIKLSGDYSGLKLCIGMLDALIAIAKSTNNTSYEIVTYRLKDNEGVVCRIDCNDKTIITNSIYGRPKEVTNIILTTHNTTNVILNTTSEELKKLFEGKSEKDFDYFSGKERPKTIDIAGERINAYALCMYISRLKENVGIVVKKKENLYITLENQETNEIVITTANYE